MEFFLVILFANLAAFIENIHFPRSGPKAIPWAGSALFYQVSRQEVTSCSEIPGDPPERGDPTKGGNFHLSVTFLERNKPL